MHTNIVGHPVRKHKPLLVTPEINSIGRNLRELRQARGLSQDAMGAVIGIERSTLAGIETGRDYPSVPALIRIARALGVSLDDLCRDIPERTAA